MKRICQNCTHWTPNENDGRWGHCAIAATGLYRHRRGYTCRHTTSRYYNTIACKIRFIPRKELMNNGE